MIIHDISMQIAPDMMVYKDSIEKKPIFKTLANHKDNGHHETMMTMDIHCGTHIDMPLHMIENGKTMDDFDFKRLITFCKVFDLSNLIESAITKTDIENLDIQNGDFILFKTKNSLNDMGQKFDKNFVYIDKSAAKYLADVNVNGVGIDALGIERNQPDHITHISLLVKDIIILEGLMLKDIEQGEYELIALPIKLKGTEGAWVRAVLVER